MTDPYQQNPGSGGGPQYGPPGTGPDLSKPQDAPGQPPYGAPMPPPGQPPYGQPAGPYGQQPGGYPAPPPYYGAPQGYNPNDPEAPWGRDPFGVPLSDKQKLIAGLLQIFVPFGIGRFYLGYTNIGVAQLLVSLLTCGVGSIWAVIDGVMILVGKVPDPEGRPLRD